MTALINKCELCCLDNLWMDGEHQRMYQSNWIGMNSVPNYFLSPIIHLTLDLFTDETLYYFSSKTVRSVENDFISIPIRFTNHPNNAYSLCAIGIQVVDTWRQKICTLARACAQMIRNGINIDYTEWSICALLILNVSYVKYRRNFVCLLEWFNGAHVFTTATIPYTLCPIAAAAAGNVFRTSSAQPLVRYKSQTHNSRTLIQTLFPTQQRTLRPTPLARFFLATAKIHTYKHAPTKNTRSSTEYDANVHGHVRWVSGSFLNWTEDSVSGGWLLWKHCCPASL